MNKIFKLEGKLNQKLTKLNLFFIFVFLNIWDFVVNRAFFNGMVFGMVMFLPSSFFWYIGNLRAIVLLTLISIFEFVVMLVFVLEGLELGGAATGVKSLFWFPYLVMAGVNAFLGLKIYSEVKEKKAKYQQI